MPKNIIILFCIILTFVFIFKSNKQDKVTHWANTNGYEIVELEEKENIGPFEYKEKSQKIYRARIKSGNQYKWVWLRVGLWTDVLEER